MGRHPRPTGSLVGGGYPSAEVQSAYSTAPADRATCLQYLTDFQWILLKGKNPLDVEMAAPYIQDYFEWFQELRQFQVGL